MRFIRLVLRCLVVLVLPWSNGHAQNPADERLVSTGTRLATGAPSQARFAIGLTRDAGLTFRNQARANDAIRIAIQVTPEPLHVGQIGDVFVVVLIDGIPHMVTGTGITPWDGVPDRLQPLLTQVTLTETLEVDVFNGVVGVTGEFPFYAAYRVASSGDLHYSSVPQKVSLTLERSPTESVSCHTFGDRTVTVGYRGGDGVFTHAPFKPEDMAMLTNGEETNDARFAYTWIKNRGESVPIYAPADGVLIRMRHKVKNLPVFDSDDFDMFFLVACDPDRPGSDVMFRFNHITEPRPDIKAAYAFGTLGAPTFDPEFVEHEERQVPLQNIAVKAGDYIGSTSGNPGAFGFDFQIGINDATVCPFEVLVEPHRSALLALMGPQTNTPFGPPVPGYPCKGYGGRP